MMIAELYDAVLEEFRYRMVEFSVKDDLHLQGCLESLSVVINFMERG